MPQLVPTPYLPLFLGGLLSGLVIPQTATAQLTLTALTPMANARAVPRTSAVTATFSQPLTATSAGALQVYSAQRGGLRTRGATPAVVSGNTLGFVPSAYPFLPGETVFSTLTPAAASPTSHLAAGKVVQFTAAVAGTGRGIFTTPAVTPNLLVSFSTDDLAVGDVDGDGDLDFLTANQSANSVSLRLNGGDNTGSNTGVFSNGAEIATDGAPYNIVLGDVDGDGDLDVLTANFGRNTVSVRLNGGDATGSNTGRFSNGADVNVGVNVRWVAAGDVDGDGDLDVVAALENYTGTVVTRLNGGDNTGSNTGVFSNGTSVNAGLYPASVLLGDVDGDGDLDLLTTASTGNGAIITSGPVQVRLNGGDNTGSNTGVFSNGSAATAGNNRYATLGDVDGDGDLDLLTTNAGSTNTVSVRLNGGDATGSHTGLFSNGSTVSVAINPLSLALGDVDSDGDLDLLAAGQGIYGTVSVRLNGGDATGSSTGLFNNGSEVGVGSTAVTYPARVVLGDVDGDGDLDLLTANISGSTVSIRLNEPAQPLATRPVSAAPSLLVAPTVVDSERPHYTYSGPTLGTEAVLSIYSLTGQRLFEQTTGVSATGILPTTGLASGWYVVQLQTNAARFVTRFYQP